MSLANNWTINHAVNDMIFFSLCTAWTSYSACSTKCGIGTITRRRHIIKYPAYGGSFCPYLVESRQCGSPNGGCGDICNPVDGSCSCVSRPGYKLESKDYLIFWVFELLRVFFNFVYYVTTKGLAVLLFLYNLHRNVQMVR